MANALQRFFATGPDLPVSADGAWIDAQFRRHRLRVMLAITLGYGLIYTCRLALNMVKKPLMPNASPIRTFCQSDGVPRGLLPRGSSKSSSS